MPVEPCPSKLVGLRCGMNGNFLHFLVRAYQFSPAEFRQVDRFGLGYFSSDF